MDTALLAAAGQGTRYFGYPSLVGKSHITVNGKPLFEYLVEPLRHAGIEKLVIHSNIGCERNFGCFEPFFDVVVYGEPNFPEVTYIPYAWENRLPEHYLFLFGHQPIHVSHLAKLLRLTGESSMGTSVYPDYKILERVPVNLRDEGDIEFIEDSLGKNVKYIGAPYFIHGPVFARLVRDDNFKHWSGHYIRKSHQEGTNVKGLQSEMLPEFDYPWQWSSVEQFIARQLRS